MRIGSLLEWWWVVYAGLEFLKACSLSLQRASGLLPRVVMTFALFSVSGTSTATMGVAGTPSRRIYVDFA